MTYTGAVTPGGPAATRELSHLTISKLSVGPMDNNAYLLRCTDTGDAVLIDAANEPDRLIGLAGPGGVGTVITTHRHPDHWSGLSDFVAATGARSLAHAADAEDIPVVTATLADGDTITVGTCTLEVIHLVGHTPGSIALLYTGDGGHLFTGDSLFPGGVGNTFGNAENFATLVEDVATKIFDRLPDGTWFYPGHGNDSTLGEQRSSLPEWRSRGW